MAKTANEEKIRSVIVEVCEKYPYPSELSNARLTKLVYLADWRMATKHGRTITGIRWIFNHYGPWVSDVQQVARESSDLVVRKTVNAFGSPKTIIALAERHQASTLDKKESKAVQRAMDDTKQLAFVSFIEHVYATRPIAESDRYAELDLVEIASAR